MNQLKKT